MMNTAAIPSTLGRVRGLGRKEGMGRGGNGDEEGEEVREVRRAMLVVQRETGRRVREEVRW